jgi:hypothetical protein
LPPAAIGRPRRRRQASAAGSAALESVTSRPFAAHRNEGARERLAAEGLALDWLFEKDDFPAAP